MKPFIAFLIAICTLILIIFLAYSISPIEGLTGAAHPEFPGMKVSPYNTDLFSHTKWLGYSFALGIIWLFISILIIGSRKKGQTTGMSKWIGVFGILYSIVFSLMIFSNWAYVNESNASFFGQMPRPTAWMIYVVWLSPLFLTLLYVFKFEDWVISPEEEAELKEYLKINEFAD